MPNLQKSKDVRRADLRSRGNLDLLPTNTHTVQLGDTENFVRFQNTWENKGENGMSDLDNRGKNETKGRGKKLDNKIRETMEKICTTTNAQQ